MSVCRMELDATKASTMASCAKARITMDPTKEVLTTFHTSETPGQSIATSQVCTTRGHSKWTQMST